jgi:hypothetical protein
VGKRIEQTNFNLYTGGVISGLQYQVWTNLSGFAF